MKQVITHEQFHAADLDLELRALLHTCGETFKGVYNISEKFTIGRMLTMLSTIDNPVCLTPFNDLHIGYTVSYNYLDGEYEPWLRYASPDWLKDDHTKAENEAYFNDVMCDSLFEAIKVKAARG